jgi:hypothetical protein
MYTDVLFIADANFNLILSCLTERDAGDEVMPTILAHGKSMGMLWSRSLDALDIS